jgi:hypothetical protein
MAGKRGGALQAPLWERFWTKVERTKFCWVWVGALNSSGYGVIWDGYSLVYAHRLSWLMHGGDPLNVLEIDHLCRNRACVNPDHLDRTTHVDNVLRGFQSRYGPGWVRPADRSPAPKKPVSDEARARMREAQRRRRNREDAA